MMPGSSGFLHQIRWGLLVLILVVGAALVPLLLRPANNDNILVVYCAHDSIFADEIIQRFELLSGIRVHVRYDEEASKSLGLTNLLIAEKERPRCDVFWNNQTLGTIRLQQLGVLASYIGPEHARIPAAFKDADGYWAGFAARMRVYIVNNDRMPAAGDAEADLSAVEQLLQGNSLREFAIAVPLYGTTLSHYAVLAGELGLDQLKAWHRSLQDRGVRLVRGNGAVKDLVAEGVCKAGLTDTDDAFVALQQNKPVRMLPVRLPADANGVRRTLVLPNSVALIAGAPHALNARRFIDFLLSEETELSLAESASHQIPLGPVDEARLPADVRQLRAWAQQGISLDEASRQHSAVLEWLSAEHISP